MPYDTSVPRTLKDTQTWFAGVITQPIDDQSNINPIAPSGRKIIEEASEYIIPSPFLQPYQRIELYNQQYWWRLLAAVQEIFPFTLSLFGFFDFNRKLGIPYLEACPPNTWALNLVGERFPQWIDENYHEVDKPLVLDSAKVDWAYYHAFTQESKPFLDAEFDFSEFPIYLQPHVHLFSFPYSLMTMREEFLKEKPDHWLTHDFPLLERDRNYYYLIFRNPLNQVFWTELEEGSYFLLSLFKNGCTLDDACSSLEKQSPHLREAAEERLHLWFQDYVLKRLLTIT